MISVCMAAYNGEPYIGRQISSIIKQLDTDDEIVIVDDHSTDKTIEIINSFKDSRIKLITNKKNLGIIKTFEKALESAKGEFIFLSDQDDEWLDNKISTIIEIFRNDKVDLVRHDAIITDVSGKILYDSWSLIINPGTGIVKNFCKNTYTGCCMAFKREVVQTALPINIRVQAHDQWIGIIAELYGFRVKFISDKLIKYVRHGANFSPESRRKLIPIFKGRFQLLKCIFTHLLMKIKQ